MEFKKIPFFSKYEINREGVIRNCTTKKVYKPTKTLYGVLSIQLTNDSGNGTTRTVSSLLESIFKENKDGEI